MAKKRFVFNSKTLVNTTTDIFLSSGSGTASNLFDRKPKNKWVTVGENSDANTATISWVAPSATIISGIMLVNHNFENFSVHFNSTPASQFSPGLSVTGNTQSNTYYSFASQSINSVDINIANTHIANAEKFCGQMIIIKEEKLEFQTNPDFSGYNPVKFKKGAELEAADGGIVSVFLSQKFRASIELSDIQSNTHSTLTAIYNEHDDFLFSPYPANTFTSNWDGQVYAVNWVGDLDIDRLRNNVIANGTRGSIRLAEIPN